MTHNLGVGNESNQLIFCLKLDRREMSELVIKNIVFVGDGSVGKTSLLYAFKNKGRFRISYGPTM